MCPARTVILLLGFFKRGKNGGRGQGMVRIVVWMCVFFLANELGGGGDRDKIFGRIG